MNAISANSKNIDLALKYQELVNTNLEYRDIIRYGIKGTHWNLTDIALAKRTKVGVDNYNPWQFSQGSYSLSTVEEGNGVEVDPKMWDVVFEGYKEAVETKTIGFSFDRSEVADKVAACKSIKEKYIKGLETGTSDPEVEIPKMIKDLETAGIREIQAEAQKQLDEFLNK
jgi:putative aldouronate transport system substrate-binding protein